jgi:hypothetical protein
MSWNLTHQQNITGEQIGSYFGYSLCVVDVDGDGKDDLIIGAPMYTTPNNEGKYENGMVYVMLQSVSSAFTYEFQYFSNNFNIISNRPISKKGSQ